MKIDLYSNEVAGGWAPADLETGLGGSEECLVLWSRALAAAGHEVTVYHTPPPAPPRERGGEKTDATGDGAVRYRPRAAFEPHAPRDVLVTWKDRRPWQLGARPPIGIHWSSDVEMPWHPADLKALTAFVCLTPYHRGRLSWLPDALARVIPLGIDLAHLDAHRREREPETALYASSPDRGLARLLADWPRIRARYPAQRLRVTYGWRQFEACTAGNPEAQRFRAAIERGLAQPRIEPLGLLGRDRMAEEYWRAGSWLLPLERADAELFCLNAIKARHAGCVRIVRPLGALQDTAGPYYDYDALIGDGGSLLIEPTRPQTEVLDWREVVARYWLPLLGAASPPAPLHQVERGATASSPIRQAQDRPPAVLLHAERGDTASAGGAL